MLIRPNPGGRPRPAVRKNPEARPEPQVRDTSLDDMSLIDLRKRAGVKEPGVFRKVLNFSKMVAQGVRLALAVAPTLGNLILAREAAVLESRLTGETPQAPADWLKENRPSAYASSISTLIDAASAPMQQVLGLSPSDLADVQEHYYQSMAPVVEDGVKTTAPFLREIAKRSVEQPGQGSAGFVFLGEKLKGEAEHIMSLWNSDNRPPTNPFPEFDQRSIIWNRLEKENAQGKLPIFVDVDGDYSTFTGTEFVGKTTLASLRERNNRLGDDYADSGVFFAWLTTRQESYSSQLAPYLSGKSPEFAHTIKDIKAAVTPPLLGGEDGMGLWPAASRVKTIPAQLSKLEKNSGEAGWIDALVSLDRDVLTGVQSMWMKVLRELPREQRQEVLSTLPQRALDWNLKAPGETGFDRVAPTDGPDLSELNCQGTPTRQKRPYDRGVALQEVLEHTLDGLGLQERREMLTSVRNGVKQNRPRLEEREARLRASLGSDYGGVDLNQVLNGKLESEKFEQAVSALRQAAQQAPREATGQEARRHAELLEFLYKLDSRYGEVDQIIHRLEGDFSKHPLGISEFFIPPAEGETVTPLGQAQQVPIRLGNAADPNPIKVSQVLEGGGGRGFAYPEALIQMEKALANSEHGYEVDEFIGTSAGSMPAALLAAGFKPDELRAQMEAIDFKSFNADAVWMMGGVDPKVRGVERNGLFSTQIMYQTFAKVLGEKLGVEGRPVLFRDMPHNLKIVTTVMNTDLPEGSPLREFLDEDGRFVFSTERTPNVDVAGALAASAAVPFFFQAHQMLVTTRDEDGQVESARMQMADGGTVDNLSTSSASTEEDQRMLFQMPVHTSTIDPKTGMRTALDTLNFDSSNLDVINAHNRKLYSQFAPKLDGYLQTMKSHGVQRAVFGYNLARPKQQPLPAVQGNSEELTLRALIRAKELSFPTLSKERGDSIIRYSERPPSVLTDSVATLFDRYIDNRPGEGDGQGAFHRDERGFHYHPDAVEENDIFDMARAAGGAVLSASSTEHQQRRFQK